MHITYDTAARAAYVRLSGDHDFTVSRTQEIGDSVFLDLDTYGHVLGIEILDVSAPTIEDSTAREQGGADG